MYSINPSNGYNYNQRLAIRTNKPQIKNRWVKIMEKTHLLFRLWSGCWKSMKKAIVLLQTAFLSTLSDTKFKFYPMNPDNSLSNINYFGACKYIFQWQINFSMVKA